LVAKSIVPFRQAEERRYDAIFLDDVNLKRDRRRVVKPVDRFQLGGNLRTWVGDTRIVHSLNFGKGRRKAFGQTRVEGSLGRFNRQQGIEVTRIGAIGRVEVLGVIYPQLIGKLACARSYNSVVFAVDWLGFAKSPLRGDVIDADQPASGSPSIGSASTGSVCGVAWRLGLGETLLGSSAYALIVK
jgi:hypothetical protein